jgi:hypothetical protein
MTDEPMPRCMLCKSCGSMALAQRAKALSQNCRTLME